MKSKYHSDIISKGICPLGQVPFFVSTRGQLTIYRQKRRKICDILRFYLVVQHYFSIFVAKFATLFAVLCRTKFKSVMYIHERDNWTNFRWDTSKVSLLQEIVFRKQGLLYGRLSSLGFDSKLRAMGTRKGEQDA